MSAVMGFCHADSDNLLVVGVAAGSTTWTPDGLGGGILAVTAPGGDDCTGEFLGDSSYYVLLSLSRGMCGRRYRIAVSGQGGTYTENSPTITVQNGAFDFVLQMTAPGGNEACGSGDLVLVSGSNPVDVNIGCGGNELYVTLSGVIYKEEAQSWTITITLL